MRIGCVNYACFPKSGHIPYSAKFWRGKILAKSIVSDFWRGKRWRIANNIISCFSESGIWLGKILANNVQFAKFAKVFPRQNFALYGMLFYISIILIFT